MASDPVKRARTKVSNSTKYARRYTFLGTGTIWDYRNDRPLCKFDREGKFTTTDPKLIASLLYYKVPFEGDEVTELEEAEAAVVILTDRVKVLEELNSSLRDELSAYRDSAKSKVPKPREQIIAELDYYGIPTLHNLSDKRLQDMLLEFKAITVGLRKAKNEEVGNFMLRSDLEAIDDVDEDEDDDDDYYYGDDEY